jgi:hypothetical protein
MLRICFGISSQCYRHRHTLKAKSNICWQIVRLHHLLFFHIAFFQFKKISDKVWAWAQCYRTFYYYKLQMFVISQSVRLWQVFQA